MKDYSHYQRPCRLSEQTHTFCDRALSGEFGKAMSEHYCAIVDVPGYAELSPFKQVSHCIKAIVEQCPIRLTDGELLAGSATFDKARAHEIPAALKGDDPTLRTFRSHSHLTPHFQKILKRGLRGLEAEIAASREVHTKKQDVDALRYLDVLEENVGYIRFWHKRYLDAIDARIAETDGAVKTRWEEVRENLTRVPYAPAENFREAVQSLWFVFAYLRLTGNWSAVGRFDWMLGPYLKKDLAEGKITLDQAREYVAHFWIKGCEWVDLEPPVGHPDGAGDGQFYQNVVLSGKDADGNDETNEVTYLVLEVLEELAIADYPTSVRISSDSPEKLIRKVAEVTRYGGGLIAVYNNDTVVDGLVRFGYSREEASHFANDGCWEVQIPGKTRFSYWPWDVLAELQQRVLKLGEAGASDLPYKTFDELFDAYKESMRESFYQRTEKPQQFFRPNPVMSLFVEDCIGKARDFGENTQNGAVYWVDAPHAGGIVDAANALQAIEYLVYDEKRMSLNEFMDIVRADWEGNESLRQELRTKLTYYGNGDKNGDAMMHRLYDAYIEIVEERPRYDGKLFPAGISTFGRQVTPEFLDHRTANPDGHKKGEFLSNNISPTPGTDLHGATATLRSYGSLDMRRLPGGTALEIKMSNATVRGDDGLEGLVDLLYAFCDLGCHFMQLDVVDAELLKKAYEDPDAYGTLVVRVSGWSSRFRTLQRQWQKMVVERTEMGY